MTRLNLGAGSRIMGGWVNVDRVRLPGIDVVFDLDTKPLDGRRWPWADGTVSAIEARDVFEHVHDPIWFMTECHRILKPGGVLHIRTPHINSPDSWTDPTHVRHCNEHSFDFWTPGNPHYAANNAAYGGVAYDLVNLVNDHDTIDITLRKPA